MPHKSEVFSEEAPSLGIGGGAFLEPTIPAAFQLARQLESALATQSLGVALSALAVVHTAVAMAAGNTLHAGWALVVATAPFSNAESTHHFESSSALAARCRWIEWLGGQCVFGSFI
jgi:hypothetical protein